MSDFAENRKEKIFEYYSNFPQELQMMVVDEMQADDRCRFTRCSKLSRKQAKLSKQFIYGLVINGDQDFMEIEVIYNDNRTGEYPAYGLTLELEKEFGKNVLRYLNFERHVLWRMELCQSTDLLQLGVQMFKLLLKDHQNSVKYLDIRGKPVWEKLESLGFGIESLRNLEEIFGDDILIKPLFSMLRRPLKDLTVFELDDNEKQYTNRVKRHVSGKCISVTLVFPAHCCLLVFFSDFVLLFYKMSNFAENKEEKVFEFYSNFPQEVQMMVVDEMQAGDRCRFTRCSKLSRKQAKLSKKFIYGLVINGDQDFIYIKVFYNDYKTAEHPPYGIILELEKEFGKNVLRYLNFKREELWRMELCQTTDLLQLGVQMFKTLLKDHQNSVKKLDISGKPVWEKLESLGFGVKSLRNLQEIFGMHILIKPLFPMLRRPLKYLTAYDLRDFEDLQNFKEIYQVEEKLEIRSLKLNNAQFLRLTALNIKIHIGYLTPQDILSFIKSWQNGLIRENLRFCLWQLEGSNFDADQLFGCFEGVTSFPDSRTVNIDHNKDPSKNAALLSHSTILMFETNDPKNIDFYD